MRDAQAFTVDDPRFSTAQVVGPSMLSLDGVEHDRHRAPFVGPFRAGEVAGRFAQTAEDEAERLIDELAPAGAAELRRAFAGPMAASIVTRALGLGRDEVADVLGLVRRDRRLGDGDHRGQGRDGGRRARRSAASAIGCAR